MLLTQIEAQVPGEERTSGAKGSPADNEQGMGTQS